MQRRDFLKLAALTLATVGCTSQSSSPSNPSSPKQSIIVIGAGIAGLAAAKMLNDNGYSVQIIEARERVGGRIWTSNAWSDVPIDLGASWIHGVTDNPITAIATQINARTASTTYESVATYAANGTELNPDQEAQFERWSNRLRRLIEQMQDDDDDQDLQSAVRTAAKWDQLSADEQTLINFILNSTIEQEYGGSSAALSTYWFDSAEEYDGGDELFLAGYRQITDFLAQNLTINLNETVQKIQHDATHVTITTNKTSYITDHVIVTLPLGVLKKDSVTFDPALPEPKRQAIGALGMGVLNKCYLRFPNIFWDADIDWLEYIPSDYGQWTEWVSFARPTNQPILLGFAAADFGREIEPWTDAEIVASAMGVLRTIFGAEIPEPTAYQITRWASDPLSFGAYSFNAIGSNPRMRDTLAQSINKRLFFAGEATHRQYFGTVHGAYLSGVRAANEIIKA